MSRKLCAWMAIGFGVLVAGFGSYAIYWPNGQLALANEAIRARRWTDAAIYLDRIIEFRPSDISILRRRAEVAVALRDPDAAISFLDRVPPDARDAATLLRRGELLLSLYRGPEAEAALLEAIQKNHHLIDAMGALGKYYAVLGRDRESLSLLWQAYKEAAWPRDRLSLLKTIVSIQSGVDLAATLREVEQFAANANGDFYTRVALGALLVRAGRISVALPLLDACRVSDPQSRRVREALADAYIRLGRTADAASLIGEIYEIDSGDASTWWLTGQIAELRQDWPAAAHAFMKALSDPRLAPECHYRLGLVLDQLGDSDGASGHRMRAAELEDARHELTKLKLELDSERRSHSPRFATLLSRLGALYEEMGWNAAAAAWFRESLVVSHSAEVSQRFGELREHLDDVGVEDMYAFTNELSEQQQLRQRISEAHRTEPPQSPSTTRWREIAASAGVRFQYQNGAQGQFALRETMGAGVATFDFDGDGSPDVFFVNSDMSPNQDGTGLSEIFRNRPSGPMESVTVRAGLIAAGYLQGCTAADVDNDGFNDLFVSGYRTHGLFRNNGDGTFSDHTSQIDPVPPRWETSCAFADLTGHGHVSLYVTTYVSDDPDRPAQCRTADGKPIYCLPHGLEAEPDLLLVNRGDGGFEDSGESAGIADPSAKGLGVVIAHFDDDEQPDIFVANDTTPNQLFLNQGGLQFVDDGLMRGAAYGGNGRVRAGMGVACGDTANRGRLDLVITNFFQEPNTFLWNLGDGYFHDRGVQSGLAGPSYLTLGFGTVLIDGDNDGWLDCFVSNGHINANNPGRVEQAMPPQWFANHGGRFEDASHGAGAYFSSRFVGRGAAAADLDNDGRMDLVVTHQDRPAAILQNESPQAGSSIVLELVGRASNRSAIGARVTAQVGEMHLMREIIGGGSYLSSSELRVALGLGQHAEAQNIVIRWPSGRVQSVGTLAAGHWGVREGSAPRRGHTRSAPLPPGEVGRARVRERARSS